MLITVDDIMLSTFLYNGNMFFLCFKVEAKIINFIRIKQITVDTPYSNMDCNKRSNLINRMISNHEKKTPLQWNSYPSIEPFKQNPSLLFIIYCFISLLKSGLYLFPKFFLSLQLPDQISYKFS